MSETTLDQQDLKRRMNGALANLKEEFASLRTGRASASLLDPITVDAYGAKMPMNQVASVSVPEPRMLAVQVWDAGLVKSVEKAIMESSLGLNPMTEGQTLRIPLPELTQDRRKDLTKVAHEYAEQARIAVRNVRRDGMDTLKKLENDKEISEDELHKQSDEVQKLTDSVIKQIDEALDVKDADIMQV
ncbi:Ribosome recycling factor [hydrothermal vent metagenome]|uniref:Ribosome recycling factor n=1 Tax=hydrothermal vent metagenome TaxID=652676 RepID=A0A3B0RIH8_9ZZZZ